MQTTTIADLLSDLRAVADIAFGRLLRFSEIDSAEELVAFGLAYTVHVPGHGRCLVITDAGLDALFATRDVVLPSAA